MSDERVKLDEQTEEDFDCLLGMAVLAAKAMKVDTDKLQEIIARIRAKLEEALAKNEEYKQQLLNAAIIMVKND